MKRIYSIVTKNVFNHYKHLYGSATHTQSETVYTLVDFIDLPEMTRSKEPRDTNLKVGLSIYPHIGKAASLAWKSSVWVISLIFSITIPCSFTDVTV